MYNGNISTVSGKKRSMRKLILTSVSVLAILIFFPSVSYSASLNPTGSNPDDDGTDTVNANDVSMSGDIFGLITLDGPYELTTNGNTIEGDDGRTESGITTGSSSASILTISNGGIVTIDNTSGLNTSAAVDIQHVIDSIEIQFGGSIIGDNTSSGLLINAGGDLTNGLLNVGTIESDGATGSNGAIVINSGSGIALFDNYGDIQDVSGGIALNFLGTATETNLTNYGTIDSFSGIAISFTGGASLTGDVYIDNDETISSGATTNAGAAIYVGNADASTAIINNTGVITSDQSAGGATIYWQGANSILGTIYNNGEISALDSSYNAIDASNSTVDLALDLSQESGYIIGNVYGGSGADNIDFLGGDIYGNIGMGGNGFSANTGDTINFGGDEYDVIDFDGTLKFDIMNVDFGVVSLNGGFTGAPGSSITVDTNASLYIGEDSSIGTGANAIYGVERIAAGKTLTTSGDTTVYNDGTLLIDVTNNDGVMTYGKISGSGTFTLDDSGFIIINVTSDTGQVVEQTLSSVVTASDLSGVIDGEELESIDLDFYPSGTMDFTQVVNGNNIDILVTAKTTGADADNVATQTAAVSDTIGSLFTDSIGGHISDASGGGFDSGSIESADNSGGGSDGGSFDSADSSGGDEDSGSIESSDNSGDGEGSTSSGSAKNKSDGSSKSTKASSQKAVSSADIAQDNPVLAAVFNENPAMQNMMNVLSQPNPISNITNPAVIMDNAKKVANIFRNINQNPEIYKTKEDINAYLKAENVEALLGQIMEASGIKPAASNPKDKNKSPSKNNKNKTSKLNLSRTGIATGGEQKKFSAWGQLLGVKAKQGWSHRGAGFKSNTGGFVVGGDMRLDKDTLLGAAFSYADTMVKSQTGWNQVDSYNASVYGSYSSGRINYQGIGSYTFNVYDARRFTVDNTIALAEYTSRQYSAKGTISYAVPIRPFLTLTPFVSGQYTLVAQDEYTEKGSTSNIHLKTDKSRVLELGSGFNLAYTFKHNGVTYTPSISNAYYYDHLADRVSTTSNFSTNTALVTYSSGKEPTKKSYSVGLGLDIITQNNLTLSFGYSVNRKNHFISQALYFKLKTYF